MREKRHVRKRDKEIMQNKERRYGGLCNKQFHTFREVRRAAEVNINQARCWSLERSRLLRQHHRLRAPGAHSVAERTCSFSVPYEPWCGACRKLPNSCPGMNILILIGRAVSTQPELYCVYPPSRCEELAHRPWLHFLNAPSFPRRKGTISNYG